MKVGSVQWSIAAAGFVIGGQEAGSSIRSGRVAGMSVEVTLDCVLAVRGVN